MSRAERERIVWLKFAHVVKIKLKGHRAVIKPEEVSKDSFEPQEQWSFKGTNRRHPGAGLKVFTLVFCALVSAKKEIKTFCKTLPIWSKCTKYNSKECKSTKNTKNPGCCIFRPAFGSCAPERRSKSTENAEISLILVKIQVKKACF